MNDDQIKGTIDEAIGTVKRKTGEWTGDALLQVKGIAQQVKGELEVALGDTKEAVHKAAADVKADSDNDAKPEANRKTN